MGRGGLVEIKEIDYSAVEAATGGFSLENLIGKGSHGCVYEGVLDGGKRVAVKVPSPGLQSLGDGSKLLDKEIDVMSSVRGRHLVNLLGISCSPVHGHRVLLMEHMPNGSLHDLLHASPLPLSWPRRLLVGLQVARAVRTLHDAAPPVVHRDIKSSNILFDSRWNARLADFSLAVRDSRRPQAPPTPPAGTIGYLDPCYTAPGKLSPRNDVFSFGVVLLELVSCRLAMDANCSPTSIVAWALPLIREGRALEVCDPRAALSCGMEAAVGRMLDVAASCVSSHEEERPTMGAVTAELRDAVERARWPRWNLARTLVSGRIHACVGARRAAGSAGTRARTKRIVCRDHLLPDDRDHGGGGGGSG